MSQLPLVLVHETVPGFPSRIPHHVGDAEYRVAISETGASRPRGKETSPKKRVEVRERRTAENTGRWTKEEHLMFIEGLQQHGKEWKKIANMIKTRTVVQIRTHAQKYFQKVAKAQEARTIPDDTRSNPNVEDAPKQVKRSGKRRKAPAHSPVPVSAQKAVLFNNEGTADGPALKRLKSSRSSSVESKPSHVPVAPFFLSELEGKESNFFLPLPGMSSAQHQVHEADPFTPELAFDPKVPFKFLTTNASGGTSSLASPTSVSDALFRFPTMPSCILPEAENKFFSAQSSVGELSSVDEILGNTDALKTLDWLSHPVSLLEKRSDLFPAHMSEDEILEEWNLHEDQNSAGWSPLSSPRPSDAHSIFSDTELF